MYCNGLYIKEQSNRFNRSGSYKGIDLLITTSESSSDWAFTLENDFLGKGYEGKVIWDSTNWPGNISVFSDKDRIDYYKDLNISNTSKELLFFRYLKPDVLSALSIFHSMGSFMNGGNVGFVLKELVNKELMPDTQVIMIIDIGIYEDFNLSKTIDPSLGLLIL